MEQFLPLKVPRKDGTLLLYYKKHDKEPADRSLLVCCLTNQLKEARVKKWMGVCGKIETIELGTFKKSKKAQATSEGKNISYAVVVYKRKHSMRRAMDNDWFNSKLEAMYTSIEAMETDQPIDEHLAEHIAKMEEGGFTIHMPNKKAGNPYDMYFNTSEKAERLGSRKRKRKEAEEDFYDFQMEEEGGGSKKRAKRGEGDEQL
mmetsp:Transcript_10214/g.19976  ORF Transcript_10214/g.19976 Transcript_10214/m.19976 type:complete len:203 (-) Transcript_10214:25-633(-)|eukprot:CAMPEP_0204913140 /NCGR_PEP_ID=MMETSP1397-20131031/11136_1 /ASSEMBLY_ACC=CAM_ASM_000891 /TAXON_ID=49980 /ORGANISM="Climacostomum Climacostomum virens, Strain Stock W-24" /LENGTH=202 /DNA_ID=CAMNT_0052084329 /DNA_START=469 /DNA_END=1077 /DNA_ORIENTATION=-